MRKVDVVAYDKEWMEQFKTEARKLREIMYPEIVEIFHIGSTSVPGLAAKPIIDILVIVKEITRIDNFNPAMIDLGYQPKGENGIKNRRYFNKDGANRTHHVHVYEAGNEEIIRHLAFRDFLRAHHEKAVQYGDLKQSLAKQFPYDISSYIKGKEHFVQRMEKEALSWYLKLGGDIL
ncbi:GrpB family protein [Ornithinibacillus scapharcae]|uniref:GrpB family protein n=1 Tax=Ornithinibacillus scapharcae TaxID=1147159 RepID=UPI000225B87C|nr:GrpB family protein [Ornithinibacillus scapharcae]